jgi:hypothetical protein
LRRQAVGPKNPDRIVPENPAREGPNAATFKVRQTVFGVEQRLGDGATGYTAGKGIDGEITGAKISLDASTPKVSEVDPTRGGSRPFLVIRYHAPIHRAEANKPSAGFPGKFPPGCLGILHHAINVRTGIPRRAPQGEVA